MEFKLFYTRNVCEFPLSPGLVVVYEVLQHRCPVYPPLVSLPVHDVDLVLYLLDDRPRPPALVHAQVGQISVGVVAEVEDAVDRPTSKVLQLADAALASLNEIRRLDFDK